MISNKLTCKRQVGGAAVQQTGGGEGIGQGGASQDSHFNSI